MSDRPLPEHVRPEGVSDDTVEALGKLSEALECAEEARGLLYAFHRRTGEADLMLGDAVGMLRDAGHTALADRIDTELVGRNVIQGRWTFQIVEEYDDTYFSLFTELEKVSRDQLVDGRRHLFEAEMKERERTPDDRHHTATPDDSGPQGSQPSR